MDTLPSLAPPWAPRWTLFVALAMIGPAAGLQAQGPTSARAPASLFDYETTAPPRFTEGPTTELLPGVEVTEVAYESPDGGVVTGLLARPTERAGGIGGFVSRLFGRAPRLPAIVVLHGMPGSAREAVAGWGATWAQRGALVLAIDAPWVRRGGDLTLTPRDSVEQVQLIRDLRRGIDLLAARDDVDPSKIGLSGVSYGAAMGALLVGVEPRVATAVLRVGGAGLVSRLTDSTGAPVDDLAAVADEARERWLSAMLPLEPRRFIAGAAGRPVLYLAGRDDPFVPADDSRALHDAAPEPKTVRWFDGGHALTAEADRVMIDWMVDHLGLDPEPAVPSVPSAAPPPDDVAESARAFARWFRTGAIDSLWAAMHPDMKERYPDYDDEIRTASQEFRQAVGDDVRLIAERFVWRDGRRQYWQTLAQEASGRQVVLRLVLLTGGPGIAGWGWEPPDRVPPIDSAGAPRLVGGG